MGTWKERIRELEQERLVSAQEETLPRQRLDNERIRLKAEARIKSEADLQAENNHLAEELEKVLAQLGVLKKLKEISEQIWECGEIAKKRDGNYAFASSAIRLVFRYGYDDAIGVGGTPVIEHWNENSTFYTTGGPDHWEIGRESRETSLTVLMGQNKDLEASKGAKNYLVVDDSEMHRRWTPFNFDLSSVNITQLVTFLDNELLESCLHRQQTGTLPLDLQARDEQSGKNHIKSSIPWHKRLFYKF